MEKLDEREIAVYTLIEILDLGGYNNIVLRRVFKKYDTLENKQKNFLTEIVNGTLRNLIYIDFIIDKYSKVKTTKMKPIILNTLRISVYQIYFMDRVPNHGICNSAVNLTKKKGFKGLAGFVNGVLRNILRNKEENILLGLKKAEFLSVKYSYNIWIIKYWLSQFTYEIVEEICKGSNKRNPTTIAVNTNKTTKEQLKKELTDRAVRVIECDVVNNSLKISNTSDISKIKNFRHGEFHVIGEMSQLAVEVLDPKENKEVLDMCSAPGGKAFKSSYIMKNTGKVVCLDIFEHKIELIEQSSQRLGLTNIEARLVDGKKVEKDFIEAFDYVLVDAPCSGFGIVSKKPDIKINKTFEDIVELVEIQRNLLKNSVKYLKKDGILVYSTCTISNKENIQNVEWLLENEEVELIDLRDKYDFANDKGVIEILPTEKNMLDGFFIAKMRRKN